MELIERDIPRDISFTVGVNPYAMGSVIADFGQTKVHITASVEDEVPPWMRGQGRGWVSGEYSMLPGATHTRGRRERTGPKGRTQEIQRLIGRALRSAVDLKKLGERTITVDCDVLVADGGTRSAALSGGHVALCLAVEKLLQQGTLKESPILHQLGALSVGINSNGKAIADLNYQEDSSCEVDMNLVMTREGKFVELQGTAEGRPFSPEQLNAMLDCFRGAIKYVYRAQDKALNGA